jgi:HPt (histidine-containing phosphotransfer) domain-containing protein
MPTPLVLFGAGQVRLDREGALARMGGDAKVLARLLKRFIDSHADTGQLVGSALDDNDAVGAIELLHRLAGAAASLGLTDLGRVASRFEVTLRQPAPAAAAAIDLAGTEVATLRAELDQHIALAQGLIAAELQRNPARPARLVLRANGELQEAADAAALKARANALATPLSDPSGAPKATTVSTAALGAGTKPTTVTDIKSHAADAVPPRAATLSAVDLMAEGPGRPAAARRLMGTLEALQPLLRERDLVPRELLEGLERHTEAWAILLDPRAPAGRPGSVSDAAEVIDALGLLSEQLDAYDYPQAEQALQSALHHMRSLHA